LKSRPKREGKDPPVSVGERGSDMSYCIILAGVLWVLSGCFMTYQTYLFKKQCKAFEKKGRKVVVGKNRGTYFSGKINIFLAVDKHGIIKDAAKMDNTAFLHKPKLEKYGAVIGIEINRNWSEYSWLGSKEVEAMKFANDAYQVSGGTV
jgi:Glucitol operon activator protein (GutM).